LALLLAAGDISGGRADVERTFTLPELTPADAAQLAGKRARFRISLDSAPDQDCKYTTYDCLAPLGLAAAVWLLPGHKVQDEMVVEARLVIVDHRACFGFPAQREYRLKDALAGREVPGSHQRPQDRRKGHGPCPRGRPGARDAPEGAEAGRQRPSPTPPLTAARHPSAILPRNFRKPDPTPVKHAEFRTSWLPQNTARNHLQTGGEAHKMRYYLGFRVFRTRAISVLTRWKSLVRIQCRPLDARPYPNAS
jgi:hypothetical protein